jgi:hypothetical protein
VSPRWHSCWVRCHGHGLQVERRCAREERSRAREVRARQARRRAEGRHGAREQQALEGDQQHVARAGAGDHGRAERQASYPSAKTFNPYNFGGDSGNRVEYKYKGQGRVVFAVPRYGGNMKVVRVDYDPNEDGN